MAKVERPGFGRPGLGGRGGRNVARDDGLGQGVKTGVQGDNARSCRDTGNVVCM
jgi:hypothetical protein